MTNRGYQSLTTLDGQLWLGLLVINNFFNYTDNMASEDR